MDLQRSQKRARFTWLGDRYDAVFCQKQGGYDVWEDRTRGFIFIPWTAWKGMTDCEVDE